MPIRQCYGPRAAKAPDISETMEGTAEVQFEDIKDTTKQQLSAWAKSVLGGDEANMPRTIAWRLHLSKLVLGRKPNEERAAERKRIQGARDAIRSLLFVEHDGTSFLGPLAVAGRAYLDNEGNSVLRSVNVNKDDIVTSETRILPVNPDRVWYNCHLQMHDPILL